MKTLKKILKQKPIYLHNWKNKEDVICDFDDIYSGNYETKRERIDKALLEWVNINILFASYGTDNYQGDAFVLFEEDGKLFEVNASHCSCYGLEGQFDKEETTLEALEFRLINGKMGLDYYSDNEFAAELKEFLGIV